MGVVSGIIGLILTAMFLFAGSSKLTDQLVPEVHAELTANFANLYTPLVNKYSPVQFKAEQLQMIVGIVEVSSALLLWVNGALASLLLTGTMAGALFIHLQLNDPVEKWALPAGLLVLIILRLAFSGSSSKSASAGSKAKGKGKGKNKSKKL